MRCSGKKQSGLRADRTTDEPNGGSGAPWGAPLRPDSEHERLAEVRDSGQPQGPESASNDPRDPSPVGDHQRDRARIVRVESPGWPNVRASKGRGVRVRTDAHRSLPLPDEVTRGDASRDRETSASTRKQRVTRHQPTTKGRWTSNSERRCDPQGNDRNAERPASFDPRGLASRPLPSKGAS